MSRAKDSIRHNSLGRAASRSYPKAQDGADGELPSRPFQSDCAFLSHNKKYHIEEWLYEVREHASRSPQGDGRLVDDGSTARLKVQPTVTVCTSHVEPATNNGAKYPFPFSKSPPRGSRKRERYSLSSNSCISSHGCISPKAGLIDGGQRGQRGISMKSGKNCIRQETTFNRPDRCGSNTTSPSIVEFEKRARHKTKEDRYSVIKNASPTNGKQKEKNRQKKKRKIMNSKEVIEDFSSKTILNDRITVQPFLKPGLFDNGRRSDKYVTDLTFHNMSFLKEPRHVSTGTVARNRQSKDKRSDRELKEVSAFFSQERLPHHDMQSAPHIKQRVKVDAAFSPQQFLVCQNEFDLGSREDQLSSNHLQESLSTGRRTEHTTSSLHQNNSKRQPLFESKMRSLYNEIDAQKSPEMRSPTPADIREALVQSGVFDSTGISCRTRDLAKIAIDGSHTSGLVPEPIDTQESRMYTDSKPPKYPVQIVRYHDRGTMVDGGFSCSKTQQSSNNSGNNLEGRINGTPTSFTESRGEKDAAISDIAAFTEQAAIKSTQSNTVDDGANKGSLCALYAPERPRSPKVALILRLETAADGFGRANLFQSEPPKQTDYRLHGKEISPEFECANVQQSAEAYQDSLAHSLESPTAFLLGSNPERCNCSATALPGSSFYRITPDTAMSSGYELLPRCSHHHATTTSNMDWAQNGLASTLASDPQSTIIAQRQEHQHGQDMRHYITQIEGELLDSPNESGMRSLTSGLEGEDVKEMVLTGEDCFDRDPSDYWFQSPLGICHIAKLQRGVRHEDGNTLLEQVEEEKFITSFWRPNHY